jgi:hypothetical protein
MKIFILFLYNSPVAFELNKWKGHAPVGIPFLLEVSPPEEEGKPAPIFCSCLLHIESNIVIAGGAIR